MQSIRQWLTGLGLEQYAESFESSDVDVNVLPELTEADLQQLGVSLGHRKRILVALHAGHRAPRHPPSAVEGSVAPVESLTAEGERRQVSVLFCDLIEQAMPIVRATGNRFEESCCYGLLGLEYGFLGRFEQSFASFDSAVRAARAGQEHSIECWNLKWRSHIHALKGEWEEAEAGADEGVELVQRIENIWAVNWCTVVSAYARFMASNDSSLVDRARDALEGVAGTICISGARCYLADMLCLSGHLSEAASIADRALVELQYGSYYSADVRAYRIKSMVHAAQSPADGSAAARDMERAISIARVSQRMPDLATCLFRHAQLLLLLQGAHANARSRLDEAKSLFTAMNMTWWLREVTKLRKQLTLDYSRSVSQGPG